jgi:hypothetical protein
MAESGSLASEVMHEDLQNLISQGYMIVVELVTYRVPKDPASPSLVGGIRHGVRGVLCARIWCVITLISPLAAAVLRLGAASLDSFGEPAYSSLCDPV